LLICGFIVLSLLNSNLNETAVLRELNINCSQMEGLKAIKVYNGLNTWWDGRYYPNMIIMEHPDRHILLHELAHHYCWRDHRLKGHDACFNKELHDLGEPPYVP
jgi:hypothetical protein